MMIITFIISISIIIIIIIVIEKMGIHFCYSFFPNIFLAVFILFFKRNIFICMSMLRDRVTVG